MRDGILVMGVAGWAPGLDELLAELPASFTLPIVLVGRALTTRRVGCGTLDLTTRLPVREVVDKDTVAPGRIHLAPADYHLLVDDGRRFALSTEAPVSQARPSIDVLFQSAAEVYGPRAIGLLLATETVDGLAGLEEIGRHGGIALALAGSRAAQAAGPQAHRLRPEAILPFLADLGRPTQEVP